MRPEADAAVNGRIQTLRAWAVACVVLFHFEVPGFSRGYLGVDMFFVVSGFLMGQRVVQPVLDGRFRLKSFLLARARRTLPALLVLVVVLLALGWWWMPAADLRRLAKHAFAALLQISNLVYLREGGYFDVDASQKWLLHLWSLAVEWQFYLGLPLLVLALRWAGAGARGMWLALVAAAGLSLGLFVVHCDAWCERAYFGSDTRAWQPLAGVLCCGLAGTWRASRLGRGLCQAMGLVLLVGSATGAASVAEPSVAAHGLAVLGSVLWILGGPLDGPERSPLAGPLGDMSYGLYLWHWPLAVAVAHGGWPWTPALQVGALGLSLVLGLASWHGLERPAQHHLARQATWRRHGPLGAGLLAAAACALVLYRADGQASRLPPEVVALEREALNTNPMRGRCFLSADTDFFGPPCEHNPGLPLGAVLVGDSHADALVGSLAEAAGQAGRSVWFWGYSGCLPVSGARRLDRPRNRCPDFVRAVRERIDQLPPDVPLVLVSRWSMYLHGYLDPGVPAQPRVELPPADGALTQAQRYAVALETSLCGFAQRRKVFVVAPVPEMPLRVPQHLARRHMLGLAAEAPELPRAVYDERHAVVRQALAAAQRRCGVQVLDPVPLLCDAARCTSVWQGRPLYYDDHHLSEFGNRRLLPLMQQVFAAP